MILHPFEYYNDKKEGNENKMKLIQVTYGYTLLVSIIYLIAKAFTLFIPLNHLTITAFLLLGLIFIKVNPHSERTGYPFAFDVQIPSLHRN